MNNSGRLGIAVAAAGVVLSAQTPPCGIAILRTEGSAVETRFIPAPPDHVKASVLRALPALAAKVPRTRKVQLKPRRTPNSIKR
jgi:hypothetical protein